MLIIWFVVPLSSTGPGGVGVKPLGAVLQPSRVSTTIAIDAEDKALSAQPTLVNVGRNTAVWTHWVIHAKPANGPARQCPRRPTPVWPDRFAEQLPPSASAEFRFAKTPAYG